MLFISDADTEALLDLMRPAVEKEKTIIVGYTAVYLEGDRKVCRLQECNIGQFYETIHNLTFV